ncbi:hypothetical protein LCGC14_0226900 [marine sediment metagenome]
MKSLLVITRQPPSRLCAREALDLALASAAFGVPTSLLFIDDGVMQLAKNQQADQLKLKSLAANLQALPLFGVEDIWVCAQSLSERGLDVGDCLLDASMVDSAGITALIERYDQVITL